MSEAALRTQNSQARASILSNYDDEPALNLHSLSPMASIATEKRSACSPVDPHSSVVFRGNSLSRRSQPDRRGTVRLSIPQPVSKRLIMLRSAAAEERDDLWVISSEPAANHGSLAALYVRNFHF